MNDLKVYAFSGKARSGKDTSGQFLKRYLKKKNVKVLVLSIASSLKEYARVITGWNGKEETKPREFLQTLGTDIIRKYIDEDFLVKRLIDSMKVYSYYFDVIIITDVRFIREIELLRKAFKDTKVIRIVRDNYDNGLTENQKNHQTELDLDGYNGYDNVIVNDGDLRSLQRKVISLVK